MASHPEDHIKMRLSMLGIDRIPSRITNQSLKNTIPHLFRHTTIAKAGFPLLKQKL